MTTLFKRDAAGTLRSWTVVVRGSRLITEYGVVGGEMTLSSRNCEPKNIGRANETTEYEQAELEAASEIEAKLRKGYKRTIKETSAVQLSPMLALKAPADLNELAFPVDVQPKYDGHRGLAWKDPFLNFKSRGNKEYDTLEHIRVHLERELPVGYLVDGEIYAHGISFQAMSSLIKSEQEGTEGLAYVIYDMIELGNEEMPWAVRRKLMTEWYASLPDSARKILLLSSTKTVRNIDELERYRAKCLENSFEGTMIRLLPGKYRLGARSKDLLKLKEFEDAEFVVQNIVDGVGKFEGQAVFRLVLGPHDRRTFDAVPAATERQRRDWYERRHSLIGKKVTVKFFGVSDSGIPRFPVLVAESIKKIKF